MMKATVYVTTKQDIVDPQGKATEEALQTLGFNKVNKVRIGKYIEIELDTDDLKKAEQQVEAMCQSLLINKIVEDYRFEIKGEL